MRAIRLILAAATLLPAAVAQPASADPPTQIRRWLGAEGGFGEVACLAISGGCLGFNSTATYGGEVSAYKSKTSFGDPDLVTRAWPARTGYRFFRAAVPGGLPSVAFLSTAGADAPSEPPLTASFGFRVHSMPVQPIVFYRHQGPTPESTILLSLTAEGRIAISAGGRVLMGFPITTQSWHAITISYGATKGAGFRLYVDQQPGISGALPFGGPTGPLEIGIVTPTVSPYSLAIDDYVESPKFDQPIHRARINYLMPLGKAGREEWSKVYTYEPCTALAANWQLISEDQSVTVPDSGDGQGAVTCALEGGALSTKLANARDEYLLEGIPSGHRYTSRYTRDVGIQPKPGETVLGVRLRMRGYTSGPPAALSGAFVDEGRETIETFDFEGGGQIVWGPTYQLRRNGQPWTAAALNGTRAWVDSGPSEGIERWLTAIRLDYVWVPS